MLRTNEILWSFSCIHSYLTNPECNINVKMRFKTLLILETEFSAFGDQYDACWYLCSYSISMYDIDGVGYTVCRSRVNFTYLNQAEFKMRFKMWIFIMQTHDDVIKRKHFSRNWPFVRGIHRSGKFPTQRPVTRSFDVFFDLRLNKRLSKQQWGWGFETPSWSLWRQCNVKHNSVC